MIRYEDESPFDRIRAQRGRAVEIDEEMYWYMLEVLPPLYGRGCFAMCEPYSHELVDGREVATYTWACKRGGKFFATFGTRAEAEPLLAAAR